MFNADATICLDTQHTLHVLQKLLARNWHVESQVGFTMPGASNAATVAAWRALFLDLVALHGAKLELLRFFRQNARVLRHLRWSTLPARSESEIYD